MMPSIGPMELVVVLAIALIVFGPKRLPDLAKLSPDCIHLAFSAVRIDDRQRRVRILGATEIYGFLQLRQLGIDMHAEHGKQMTGKKQSKISNAQRRVRVTVFAVRRGSGSGSRR